MRPGFVVRELNNTFIPELVEIESRCFPDPWPASWFVAILNGYELCWGLFYGKKLVGYLIAHAHQGTMHLANIAVDIPFQKRNLGRMMLLKLIILATVTGCNSILLEVRRSNKAAISLYQSEKFTQIGVKSGYYPEGEDALVFKRVINNG